MIYLEASAFLYPALYRDVKAARAQDLLRSIVEGEESGITASLTFDEVVYKVGKLLGRQAALEAADVLLAFPNLRIVSVGPDHLRSATALLREHPKMAPRDAIHAAVALEAGVSAIASDDRDLDGVPGLRRVGFDPSPASRSRS